MILRRMPPLVRALPSFLQRHILHFEATIEAAARSFATELPVGSRVLDAGAGECQYAVLFSSHKYFAVDLAIGDSAWSYRDLHALSDLVALPFSDATFDACINIVTLEHVPTPERVLGELHRVLRPGGRLLLVTPHEWEEHQQPHDYYRYTRYGLDYLLGRCGFSDVLIRPAGGFFRLFARRFLNAIQFFPGPAALVAVIFLVPPALVLPLFDRLDRRRDFTLGHICIARKSS